MNVPRGTASRLRLLEKLVKDEAQRQNLIAASTDGSFFRRHLADSLQLVPLLKAGSIADIGSGAGFPGLVLACVWPYPVSLIEPRRLRAEFLARAIEQLQLEAVTVHQFKVERATLPPFQNITARAVMALPALFAAADGIADAATRWVLPKGRSAQSELAAATCLWQGRFTLVPSRTDPLARIIVAEAVRKRGAE